MVFNRYEYIEPPNDYYSPISVSLDVLVDCGVIDFNSDEMYYPWYSDEMRKKLNEMIYARYCIRDVSIIPIGIWIQQFVRKMTELEPKYTLLYKYVENGVNFTQEENTYYKGRTIDSEFPQTMLSGNSDYASFGRDVENEQVREGNALEKIYDFVRNYQDVNALVLDEIEVLFSSLAAANINSY